MISQDPGHVWTESPLANPVLRYIQLNTRSLLLTPLTSVLTGFRGKKKQGTQIFKNVQVLKVVVLT